jgi:hypothetical protein
MEVKEIRDTVLDFSNTLLFLNKKAQSYISDCVIRETTLILV